MHLQGSWIAIDASCPTLQVALFHNGSLLETIASNAPAMEGMMPLIQQLCDRHRHALPDTAGFLYGSGPGSILGIRLSLMAIRTWSTLHRIPPERILHFRSLAMAAAQHLVHGPQGVPFLTCSEWKRDRWNVLVGNPSLREQSIEVWPTEKLEQFDGIRRLLPQRKLWTQSPGFLDPIDYPLDLLALPALREQLLHAEPLWEVYSPDDTRYATWSGERHRAG